MIYDRKYISYILEKYMSTYNDLYIFVIVNTYNIKKFMKNYIFAIYIILHQNHTYFNMYNLIFNMHIY